MSDRETLTTRTLPFMTLSDGSESSATRPPPSFPPNLSAEERAKERFAVKGTVVVTGGAGALGFSTARAVLEHGASGCCLWDLESTIRSNQQSIMKLAHEFPQSRVFAIAVDVTAAEEINEAVQSVVKLCGSIDHLFCFAGVVGCYHALETTEAQWKKILDVNTTGAFLCAQAVAKQMVDRRTKHAGATVSSDMASEASNSRQVATEGKSITLIASISAHRVNFPQAQAAYNVSKAAIVALKSSLAAEWAVHGIRVNSISPGYMDTILNAGGGSIAEARDVWKSRNPMGRMGALGELDGVCVMLASRAGSYINGADLVVDGGATVF